MKDKYVALVCLVLGLSFVGAGVGVWVIYDAVEVAVLGVGGVAYIATGVTGVVVWWKRDKQ